MVNHKAGYLPYPTIIAFLLEKNLIKATSDVEEENVKCAPVGATNISKMGIKYLRKAKPTRSGSQAGSASQSPLYLVQGIKKLTPIPGQAVLQGYQPLSRHLLKR